jgi:hypothetical protein
MNNWPLPLRSLSELLEWELGGIRAVMIEAKRVLYCILFGLRCDLI